MSHCRVSLVSLAIDIAIIGGGNAGLSLASELSRLRVAKTVCIFEPAYKIKKELHWSLWTNENQRQTLKHAIKGNWSQWKLVDYSGSVIRESSSHDYTCLSSAKYLSLCERQLSGKIRIIPKGVESVKKTSRQYIIEAGDQSSTANNVYDSRPPSVRPNSLMQHFLGVEVNIKKPMSAWQIATLMDFRVNQTRGLHFMYVLPFSSTHLLIESTMISQSLEPQNWYRNAIERWLAEREIIVESYLSEEVGVIPMDEVVPCDKTIPTIGVASGALRRSSGYGFSYIQDQAFRLAQQINQHNYDVPEPISKRIVLMDTIFNRVLTEYPEIGPSLFMKMAQALNGEQFARFMLGKATPSDWIRVVAAMPKVPFLKQLFHV